MPFFVKYLGNEKEIPTDKESNKTTADLEEELVVASKETASSIEVMIQEILQLDTGIIINDDDSVGS